MLKSSFTFVWTSLTSAWSSITEPVNLEPWELISSLIEFATSYNSLTKSMLFVSDEFGWTSPCNSFIELITLWIEVEFSLLTSSIFTLSLSKLSFKEIKASSNFWKSFSLFLFELIFSLNEFKVSLISLSLFSLLTVSKISLSACFTSFWSSLSFENFSLLFFIISSIKFLTSEIEFTFSFIVWIEFSIPSISLFEVWVNLSLIEFKTFLISFHLSSLWTAS